jgi:hypothetical protein
MRSNGKRPGDLAFLPSRAGERYPAPLSLLHPAFQARVDKSKNRAFTRNSKDYPRPNEFDPARWVDPPSPTFTEPLEQFPNLTGFSQFGFGKRTCQGIPIVEQDLFATMGGMAWGMDVRRQGRRSTDIGRGVHWDEYTPLLIAKPEPFRFHTLPRSKSKLHRMERMFNVATGAALPCEMRPGMAVGHFKPDPGGQGGAGAGTRVALNNSNVGWRDEDSVGSTSAGTNAPNETEADLAPKSCLGVSTTFDLAVLSSQELPEFPSHLEQHGGTFGFQLGGVDVKTKPRKRRQPQWTTCGWPRTVPGLES